MGKEDFEMLNLIFDRLDEIRAGMSEVETRLSASIDGVESRLSDNVNGVKMELRSDMKDVKKQVGKTAVDVGGLKVKTGFWGAIGGLLSGALLYVPALVKGMIP